MSEYRAHCDGGDFLAVDGYPQSKEDAEVKLKNCRLWIFEHLEKAVAAAAPLAAPTGQNTSLDCPFDGQSGSAKCLVLDHLGVALHAAQDFYSHSNWVDEPVVEGALDPKDPPGLDNAGRAPWLDPRDPPDVTPNGLISGCYDGYPELAFCNYGFGKPRIKHDYLNKDTGPIASNGATGPGRTERGAINGNFERAVAAAIGDTQDKWAYLEERLTAEYEHQYGEDAVRRMVCAIETDIVNDCK
jgi:hypothetical protein